MEQFLEKLADIFDVDEVKPDDVIENFDEYDSLSILTIISLLGSKYNKTVSVQEVRGCKTAEDLYDLASK